MAVAVATTGCASGDRKQDSPPTSAATNDSGGATDAAKEADKPADAKEEAEKAEKERRELTRKVARAKRELEAGKQRQVKTKLSAEHATVNQKKAADDAQHELTLTQRKHKTLVDKSIPERIARADLGFAGAQDGYKEADEEYKQLEMMYNEDQFADKTKEIVLERGKRRLERSKRYLEIETGVIDVLKKETIPVELIESEKGLADKREAVERLKRDHALADLDTQMSLFAAETEIMRLIDDIEDAERELAESERKQKEKAEKAATQAATTQAANQ
ncbi:MAG: hypothetical protein ACKVS9_10685 [Phycisphaerae bacterium]